METAKSRPTDLTPENSISIGPNQILSIEWQHRGNGQKFLNIYKYKSTWPAPMYLPTILVPQGAYKFVIEMDRLIRKLPVDEPKHSEDHEVLATQIVAVDRHYKFKLSAWCQTGGGCNFDIQSVPTSEEHKESRLFFPFSAVPWLRQQMVKILAEHDESERIKEKPKIPEWVTQAAPKIKHQGQQPNEKQEQMTTEKNADDDDEDCPCSTNESKCRMHMTKSSGLTNRR